MSVCLPSWNLCFYHFHFFFWWSIKFLQQNINQSKMWIGFIQIPAELYIIRKSLKCLNLMASTQPNTQKPNFHAFVKSGKKLAVKHLINKSIFLSFRNLYTIFGARISQEADFHFQLLWDPLILNFLNILVFQKVHFFFKLIFKTTQLKQRAKYDIIQKGLFFTLAWTTKSGLSPVPIAAGQYF